MAKLDIRSKPRGVTGCRGWVGGEVAAGVTGIGFRCRNSGNEGGLLYSCASIIGRALLDDTGQGSRDRELSRNFCGVCDYFGIQDRNCIRVVRVINQIERLARLERVRTFATLCEIVHLRHYNIVQQLPVNKPRNSLAIMVNTDRFTRRKNRIGFLYGSSLRNVLRFDTSENRGGI